MPVRLRPAHAFLVSVGVGLAAACAREASEGSSGRIVGGALDRDNSAVVQVVSRRGERQSICTGTIVKTDTDQRFIGWVVTAAHCVDDLPPVLVVEGTDVAGPGSSVVEHPVIDWQWDPRYTHVPGTAHDFAVIRIDNVSSITPSIPLASGNDRLAKGDTVTSVGYGTTSADPQSAPVNSKRHSIIKQIEDVDSDFIVFDMAKGGFCGGDSGGPLIAGIGRARRVVGVQSFHEESCRGRGFSGRVTTAGATFFDAELARGKPSEYCDRCSKLERSGRRCMTTRADCFDEPDCRAYFECRSVKGKAPPDCADHEMFERRYQAIIGCGCDFNCRKVCVTLVPPDAGLPPTPPENPDPPVEEADAGPPHESDASTPPAPVLPPPSEWTEVVAPVCRDSLRCGLELDATWCGGCVQKECCSETLACAFDKACREYTPRLPDDIETMGNGFEPPIRGDAGASAAQRTRSALLKCGVTNCSVACGVRPPRSQADAGGAPGDDASAKSAGETAAPSDVDPTLPITEAPAPSSPAASSCAMTSARSATPAGVAALGVILFFFRRRRSR